MLLALATTDFKAPSEGADAFMRLTSTLLTACLIATGARVGGRFRVRLRVSHEDPVHIHSYALGFA